MKKSAKSKIQKFLNDINAGRAALEVAIGKSVTNFEKEYGVQVSNVSLERSSWQDDPDFRVNAQVDVDIPFRCP